MISNTAQCGSNQIKRIAGQGENNWKGIGNDFLTDFENMAVGLRKRQDIQNQKVNGFLKRLKIKPG